MSEELKSPSLTEINETLKPFDDELAGATGKDYTPKDRVLLVREHGFTRIQKTKRGGLHLIHSGPSNGTYITPAEFAVIQAYFAAE